MTVTLTKPAERWLAASKAAEALGISKTTLRRWAEFGLLVEGRHYRRGFTPRSPWTWECNSILDVVRKEEQSHTLLLQPASDEKLTDVRHRKICALRDMAELLLPGEVQPVLDYLDTLLNDQTDSTHP